MPCLAVGLLGALMTVCLGCGLSGKGRSAKPGSLAGTKAQQAENLLIQVQDYDAQGAWSNVVRTTGAMLDYYRTDPRCAEALALAVPDAIKLGNRAEALDLARIFRSDFPTHPRLLSTLLESVDLALAAGDSLGAATFQVRALSVDPTAVLKTPGQPAYLPLLKKLNAPQLAKMAKTETSPTVVNLLGLHRVRALLRAGMQQEAETLAADLNTRAPDDPWVQAAVALAAGHPWPGLQGVSQPMTQALVVGLLTPLSGRYAGYGNAMLEAARMGIRDGGMAGDLEVTLREADTGGDPVQTVAMARTLCARQDVSVLVGAMTTCGTVAAALVAEDEGMPLVSPTASNERIESIGPRIFQTNMSDQREIGLLARLAVPVLLKKRVAILGPDTPNGHYLAGLFADHVSALGGEVVAEAFFPPAVTDFRQQIMEVRRQRPEVLFVSASFEQYMLLGPQLDFYHVGCLVFGPGSWSQARPSLQEAVSLEGVVYPDAQARFPLSWVDAFGVGWDHAAYPDDQTAVALRVYLAVRLTVAAAIESGARTREDMTLALQAQLRKSGEDAGQDLSLATLAKGLLLFRDGKARPFPTGLFTEALAAEADSARGMAHLTPPIMDPAQAEPDSIR